MEQGGWGACPQCFGGQWFFVLKQSEMTSSYQNNSLAQPLFYQVSAPDELIQHCVNFLAGISLRLQRHTKIFFKRGRGLVQKKDVTNQ